MKSRVRSGVSAIAFHRTEKRVTSEKVGSFCTVSQRTRTPRAAYLLRKRQRYAAHAR